MAGKKKSGGPEPVKAGGAKMKREAIAEQQKMEDRSRRPEQKGSKLMKGTRRRAG
jgi:hypothetical protein